MNGAMTKVLNVCTNLFPIWVLLGGVLALVEPRWFTWFDSRMIRWGLGVIMLGMGLTLGVGDFKGAFKLPKAVAAGFVGQYCIMPFMGWAVATGMKLPTPMAVGIILVSCCPGGTASNIVTYLAKANVALSVLMTAASTMAAVVMTPLLTKFLAGARVPVDAGEMFFSTLQVVLAPVGLGVLLNTYAKRAVGLVTPWMPLMSSLTVALICASIIGQSRAKILDSLGILTVSVFILHSGGFALGYLFAKVLGYDKLIRRTISIEVGMQNSGLGVVLAGKHFPDPLTAVPCAVSSVFHSVIGSVLAGIWRRDAAEGKPRPKPGR